MAVGVSILRREPRLQAARDPRERSTSAHSAFSGRGSDISHLSFRGELPKTSASREDAEDFIILKVIKWKLSEPSDG